MSKWLALGTLALSAGVLGWALYPLPLESESIPLSAALLTPPTGGAGSGADYALQLEWPKATRVGEPAPLRLRLVPGRAAGGPTASSPGFNVMAGAKVQARDLEVSPEGETLEPLRAGGQASFAWDLLAGHAGDADVSIFVRLIFVPQEGDATVERTIWARPLVIHATTALGLTRPSALVLGGLAAAASSAWALGAWFGRRKPAWRSG